MHKHRKSRQISKELVVLRYLNARMTLLDQDWKNYFSLAKGFEGEVKFDQLTEKLESECIVINGLLLKVDNSFFQIDTVLIFQNTIYLIDVKNYEGDYEFQSKNLKHIKTDKIIKDPYIQLQRCETMFRQLLQELGFQFNVESHLIYINPEFTMYQAPQNPSVIFPTQINRFMQTLNKVPSKLNSGHEKLADLLISMDVGEYPFAAKPDYDYESLKKGIVDPSGHGFMVAVNDMKLKCCKCRFEETVESAVKRSVEEFKILFPERRVTTTEIYNWCKVVRSRRAITRILKKHFRLCGKGRFSYFV
ncbi:nuclease-related domain-containing protein [Neobacillus kokaensis]|uniref:NERD domain-containing protein n=1 Tax=Neobacillus kokaensis TaxID=2759023 RepID=A0ABQ3N407_9BACI|nr:nuclease-related domain-containing protein [Neobacillus kokaensis]GHH98580.1 hypothetical protein AM1BK_21230 [Neobacillus kokaensis]